MIQAAFSSDHLNDPHFLDGNVNQMVYLNMLKMLLISQLHEMGLESMSIMQQGGQLAYYALPVQKYLN
jgi:hypothetical protein